MKRVHCWENREDQELSVLGMEKEGARFRANDCPQLNNTVLSKYVG